MFEAYRGKRVLVTGHTGFKGAYRIQGVVALRNAAAGGGRGAWLRLAAADPARAVRSVEAQETHYVAHAWRHSRFEGRASLREVRSVRLLFHLAAQPLVRESYRTPVETFETNVSWAR